MLRRLHFHNESEAREAMRRIGVDPRGIEIMAAKLSCCTFVATDLQSAACNILKQEMLSAGGEAAVSRGTVNLAVKTSDAIICGTRKQLLRLAEKLEWQPFGLAELAGRIRASLEVGHPEPIEWRGGRLDFSGAPLLMGVINVTPDSFSDGGRYLDPGKASDQALRMAEAGAAIIDIGGESSRPGSEPVDPAEELKRILPVIERVSGSLKIPVSIDTYRSKTARAAIDAGASMVNDISGLRSDPDMSILAAEKKVPIVVMHMRGTPKTMQAGKIEYRDLMGEISESLLESERIAVEAGVEPGSIIFDPGIGFGKTPEHNLKIIGRIAELVSLGKPVLVGPSRKAFIGALTGKDAPDRAWGTAAAVAACVLGGAHVIRVHDVDEMRQVTTVAAAIRDA
jgi:dihydropteroate synthase